MLWYTGLLIFRAVAEPRNSGKSAKSHEIHKNTKKNPRNSVEILSNTCLYNIFETYFSYWGYLLAINLQIYLKTLSLKRANNIPKLPRVDYVTKNRALAMTLKALPLVTWDQALFSFHFENYILAGKAKRKQTNFSGAVRENVWEPLKLGLISGYAIG